MTEHVRGEDTGQRDGVSVPDIRTQREEIEALNQKPQEGDPWHLVDVEWMNKWKKYVDYSQSDKSSAGQKGYYPGPLDNSEPFTGDNLTPLSEQLVNGNIHIVITAQAWNKLVSWYGVSETPQPIPKPDIEEADSDKHCGEEECLVSLKLCIYPKLNEPVVMSFSRAVRVANMKKKLRKIFGTPKKTACRLWHYCQDNTISLLKPKQSLQETGLCDVQGSQTIVLEQQNEDGTWPLDTSYMSSHSMPSLASSSSTSSSSYVSSSDNLKPGLCGLTNLGNTCYMNSALQCLSNTEPLTDYFKQQAFKDHINKDNPLGMGGAVAETYNELVGELWSGLYSSCSPLHFKRVVERFAPRFSGHQQQDSQELLTFLLDGLHEDLNLVQDKPYVDMTVESKERDEDVAKEFWCKHLRRNQSIVVHLFHGQLRSTVECLQCKQIVKTFDPLMFLSVPLPARNTNSMCVVVIRADPNEHMVKYQVKVPKGGTVANLKEEIALMTQIIEELMVVVKVCSGQIQRFYNSRDPLSLILNQNGIYVYELSHPLTDPDWVHIPIQYDSSSTPTFVTVPRRKCTCRQLCQTVLDIYRRYAWKKGRAEDIAEEEEVDKLFNLMVSHTSRDAIESDAPNESAEVIVEDASCAECSEPSDSITLGNCLDLLTKKKYLSASNAWFCPQCKGPVSVAKKCDIWKLPPILVIYLTRFTHNRHWREKLHTFVDFPLKDLDLSKYVMAPEQPKPIYDLFGVINHAGSMEGGHYTAYCKNKSTGKWYKFDDSHVSGIPEGKVVSANAYVLFYHHRDKNYAIPTATLGQYFAGYLKKEMGQPTKATCGECGKVTEQDGAASKNDETCHSEMIQNIGQQSAEVGKGQKGQPSEMNTEDEMEQEKAEPREGNQIIPASDGDHSEFNQTISQNSAKAEEWQSHESSELRVEEEMEQEEEEEQNEQVDKNVNIPVVQNGHPEHDLNLSQSSVVDGEWPGAQFGELSTEEEMDQEEGVAEK